MAETSGASWGPTKTVSRGGAAEQICDDLRAQIISGALPRGARLPSEKQLAESYGVSGPTVREAIRALSSASLLEVRHGSGTYVTAQTDQIMASSLSLMIQLERIGIPQVLGVLGPLNGYAAELAAEGATQAQIDAMEHALQSIEDGTDPETIFAGLTAFVGTLADASNNQLLAGISKFLSGIQIGFTRELVGQTLESTRATVAQLAPERRALLNAIKAHKGKKARDAAIAYHEQAIEVITSLPQAQQARFTDPALSDFLASLQR